MGVKKELENHVVKLADSQIACELGLSESNSINSIHMVSPIKPIKRVNVTSQIPSLVLIRGLPGSGKSTIAKSLTVKGFLHFEADQFFQTKYGYKFDVTKLKKAHAYCIKETARAIKSNRQVVVSNCFVKLDELIDYLKLSPNTLIIEANGAWRNIHGVKDETIKKMAQSWQVLA